MTNKLIEQAVLIRKFEELILQLFREGQLNGTVHTCIGQEWTGVAVSNYLVKNDAVFSNHRGHGHFISRTGNVDGLLAEIMGKATGVCGGIGGSQHVSQDNFYSNGILGGMYPIAAGRAFSQKFEGNKNISVVFSGDGALGQGVIYETLNIISVMELPLLIVIERNGYAQSTDTKQTFAGDIATRAEAFHIKHFSGNTWETEELLQQTEKAVEWVRSKELPAILEIGTYRLAAHSKGDDNRETKEISEYSKIDPLNILFKENSENIRNIQKRVKDKLEKALTTAKLSKPCRIAHSSDNEKHKIAWLSLDEKPDRYGNLLYKCFVEIFKGNEKIIMLGEDIEGEYGGAFKITRNLSHLYPGRVINTPISEAAITGLGTGLAMGGLFPIVEIMFGDFLTLAFDQIFQHATKFETMFNNKVQIPIIIRTPMGGRRGYGPTHSQSIEGHFLGIPNLKVIALNVRISPYRVYLYLLNKSHSPSLVIENKVLYTRTLRVEPPVGYAQEFSNEAIPTVRLHPVGIDPDVTIICYGGMLEYAEDALIELFNNEEIVCDLLCITQLCPLNISPILESVQKTKRIVVLEEGKTFAAWGSEVLAQLATSGVTLDKVLRLGCDDMIPSCFDSEKSLLVDTKDIVDAVIEVTN